MVLASVLAGYYLEDRPAALSALSGYAKGFLMIWFDAVEKVVLAFWAVMPSQAGEMGNVRHQ